MKTKTENKNENEAGNSGSEQKYIVRYRDEKGTILTYGVWDNSTIKEVGEFNTLKEAREFVKGVQ